MATGWNGVAGALVCSGPPIVLSSEVNPPLELAEAGGTTGAGATGANDGAANAAVACSVTGAGALGAGVLGSVLKSSVISSCVKPPLEAGPAAGAAAGAAGGATGAGACPSTCRSRSSSRSSSPVVNFREWITGCSVANGVAGVLQPSFAAAGFAAPVSPSTLKAPVAPKSSVSRFSSHGFPFPEPLPSAITHCSPGCPC